eukprot:c12690_g1_i1.p1 GENE.c12690_g1_i1~~c12690_g1_i1.p1  ORF type:complete len:412 (+),score=80.29 c12690_g1_i1:115-1236(+)
MISKQSFSSQDPFVNPASKARQDLESFLNAVALIKSIGSSYLAMSPPQVTLFVSALGQEGCTRVLLACGKLQQICVSMAMQYQERFSEYADGPALTVVLTHQLITIQVTFSRSLTGPADDTSSAPLSTRLAVASCGAVVSSGEERAHLSMILLKCLRIGDLQRFRVYVESELRLLTANARAKQSLKLTVSQVEQVVQSLQQPECLVRHTGHSIACCCFAPPSPNKSKNPDSSFAQWIELGVGDLLAQDPESQPIGYLIATVVPPMPVSQTTLTALSAAGIETTTQPHTASASCDRVATYFGQVIRISTTNSSSSCPNILTHLKLPNLRTLDTVMMQLRQQAAYNYLLATSIAPPNSTPSGLASPRAIAIDLMI